MRDAADAGRGSRNGTITKSSEDYLEAILAIRRERGFCRNVDIAERLGVSKASVTKALGNLARRGLAEVVDRDVRLTAAGELLAEGPSPSTAFSSGCSSMPGWTRRWHPRRHAAWSTASPPILSRNFLLI